MNRVKRASKHFFLCILLTAGSADATYAFDLLLQILDEHEKPVAGAVVEMPIADAAPQESRNRTDLAIIDQIERRFVPMVLLIDTGQSVSFPNSDNVRHHVYSFSEIKQFSTPLYANELIEPVKFDEPGVAVLGCNIHDSMVAYVYVSHSAHRSISNSDGILSLPALPEQPTELIIWHPWLQTTDNRMTVDLSAATSGQQVRVTLQVKPPETQFGFRALAPDN